MKKTLKGLVSKIQTEGSGQLKGGFGKIKGGTALYYSTNDTCTNSANCTGTNTVQCTNSGTCDATNKATCTNNGQGGCA